MFFLFIQIVNLLPIQSCYAFLKWNKDEENKNTNGIINKAFEQSNESSLIKPATILDLNTSDDEMKDMRILWLRNIKRIQIQVNNNLPVHQIIGNRDFYSMMEK